MHHRPAEGREVVDARRLDGLHVLAGPRDGQDQQVQHKTRIDPRPEDRHPVLARQTVDLERQLRLLRPRPGHLLRRRDDVQAVLHAELDLLERAPGEGVRPQQHHVARAVPDELRAAEQKLPPAPSLLPKVLVDVRAVEVLATHHHPHNLNARLLQKHSRDPAPHRAKSPYDHTNIPHKNAS